MGPGPATRATRRLRHTAEAAVAALVGALALVLLMPTSAQAAETYAVPSNGVFLLDGHGWGHGRGMSVYGAQGAALQGVPYDQILARYYPGTALTPYADRTVRVKVTLDSSQVRLPAQSGLIVIDNSGAGMTLPDGYSQWRLLPVGGVLQLQGLTDTWTSVPLNGSTSLDAARFENPATGVVRVYRSDSSSVGYRGAVFGVSSGSSVLTVVHLPMEQYLRGVVPKESPPSWASGELRSQAVAARSFAATAVGSHTTSQWDVCDTDACQVFGGTSTWSASGSMSAVEYASTDAAVRDTATQVLTYQGQIANTQFSASNGGWTTSGGVPYLPAQSDPWDGTAPGDPIHSWTAKVSASDIQNAYPSIGTMTQLVVNSRDGNGEWGGRVTSVTLVGTMSSTTISGSAFAQIRPFPAYADGIRSSWFKPAADPVPFGSFDYAGGTADEGLYVAGWAIDPDTTSPIAVHVYVDGRFAAALTADGARSDVGAAYPASGPNHGFSATLSSSPGAHTVCAYGINAGPGSGNPLLGCRAVTVAANLPTGSFDYLGRAAGGMYVAGWALDPNTTGPIAVHVYADGQFAAAVTADGSRPDVGGVYPAYGPNHGYAVNIAAGVGAHTVCTYGINVGAGTQNRTLGCRSMTVLTGKPVGSFDVATSSPGSVRVAGWALDPDTPAPVAVHVYVDGAFAGAVVADQTRSDIAALYPAYGARHGFDASVPAGSGTHTVCAYAINEGPAADNPLLACRTAAGA